MAIIDYKKSENTDGAIINNNGKGYIAVTCATSREFKTLKGAERYMNKMGYHKA